MKQKTEPDNVYSESNKLNENLSKFQESKMEMDGQIKQQLLLYKQQPICEQNIIKDPSLLQIFSIQQSNESDTKDKENPTVEIQECISQEAEHNSDEEEDSFYQSQNPLNLRVIVSSKDKNQDKEEIIMTVFKQNQKEYLTEFHLSQKIDESKRKEKSKIKILAKDQQSITKFLSFNQQNN